MKILSIDTSCDDTCMCLMEDGVIIKNIISSQIALHKNWGGVVPDIAKRAHEERIESIFKQIVGKNNDIKFDVIAVTQGPGLAPALQVGINFAKSIAIKYKKKLIAVNHIEGHLLSPFVNTKIQPKYPILVLTVSGGHTMLVLIKKIGEYEIIGQTLDDAAGEALDKASKILGIEYPGGPIIEKLAKSGDSKFLKLPLPLRQHPGFDFSFSGLKTSFFYSLQREKDDFKIINLENLAASFQEAVEKHLETQLERAIKTYNPKTIFAVGGVMSNSLMRKMVRRIGKKYSLPTHFPYSKKLNTDNAAMIGYVGWQNAIRKEFVENIDNFGREPRKKL